MTLRTAAQCLLLARQMGDKAEDCQQLHDRGQYEALARGWNYIAAIARRQDQWRSVSAAPLTSTRKPPGAPAVGEAAIRERLHQRECTGSSLKLAFVSSDELPSEMHALLARIA